MRFPRFVSAVIAFALLSCGEKSPPVRESPTSELEVTFDQNGLPIVTFTTSRSSFARVEYGASAGVYTHYAYQGDGALSSHSVKLIGADAGTHYVRAVAESADGSEVYESEEEAVSVGPHDAVPVLEVTVIDVGWGDAIFVRTPSGRTFLCDTGFRSYTISSVIPYLRDEAGITRVDYLAASHCHGDHIGGMADVIAAFDVGLFMDVPAVSPDVTWAYDDMMDAVAAAGIVVDTVREGDTDASNPLVLGWDPDVRIVCLNAGYDGSSSDANNDSIVLKLTFGTVDILLTGDARALVEAEMLTEFGGEAVDVEVEKVPHHAVNAELDNSQQFIDAASPRVALVSANRVDNPGSENEIILARFRSAGADYYMTDNARPNATPSAVSQYRSHLRLATDGHAYEVNIDEPSPTFSH